jgi:uncharacterized protein with NRDE domain
MCLLLFALDVIPGRPWLLLGNRDEFHARASAPAAAWDDTPDIVGGRDLVAGGSWLALSRRGRFAAVTNVRIGGAARGARSRGELVGGFVGGNATPAEYTQGLSAHVAEYGPFNLIVGDAHGAWGLSSTDATPWRLEAGVHVVSNGPPAVWWPKARRLHALFSHAVEAGVPPDAALLDLLRDTAQPPDTELPSTGVTPQIERLLAPIFIRGEEYGTRASTLAYAAANGDLVLHERRFGPHAADLGESDLRF